VKVLTPILTNEITKWLEGNDASYRYIFDFFYPKLFQACLQMTQRREDSEELVMNVFFRIWQHRQSLQEVEDFERYLFRVLRNQISDYHRKNILATQPLEGLDLEKLGAVSHPEIGFKELLRIYQEAIAQLPLKQREVFLMSREEGLSQKEIAEKNNIALSTVNNHITTAVRVIRHNLGEYADIMLVLLMFCAK